MVSQAKSAPCRVCWRWNTVWKALQASLSFSSAIQYVCNKGPALSGSEPSSSPGQIVGRTPAVCETLDHSHLPLKMPPRNDILHNRPSTARASL